MQPELVRQLTGSSRSPSFAGKGREHLVRDRAERLSSMQDVEVTRQGEKAGGVEYFVDRKVHEA